MGRWRSRWVLRFHRQEIISEYVLCYIYIYIYAHTYTHTHIYIYTYIHTYIHTYTYTHIYLFIYSSIYNCITSSRVFACCFAIIVQAWPFLDSRRVAGCCCFCFFHFQQRDVGLAAGRTSKAEPPNLELNPLPPGLIEFCILKSHDLTT